MSSLRVNRCEKASNPSGQETRTDTGHWPSLNAIHCKIPPQLLQRKISGYSSDIQVRIKPECQPPMHRMGTGRTEVKISVQLEGQRNFIHRTLDSCVTNLTVTLYSMAIANREEPTRDSDWMVEDAASN
jgi:hypothetical protein